MLQQDLLDLAGRDVLSSAQDGVLDPAGDPDVSVGVHHGEVARVVPPVVVQHRGRPLRVAQVADEHGRTARGLLALGSRRQRFVGLVVHDPDPCSGNGATVGVDDPVQRIAGAGHGVRGALGRPVDGVDRHAQVQRPFDQTGRDGRATAADPPQARVEPSPLPGRLDDVIDDRGGTHQAGRLLGVDQSQGVDTPEPVQQDDGSPEHQRHRQPVQVPGGVRQRCRHEHPLPHPQPEGLAEPSFAGQHVVVGQHHPLGLCLAPRGEEHGDHGVAFPRRALRLREWVADQGLVQGGEREVVGRPRADRQDGPQPGRGRGEPSGVLAMVDRAEPGHHDQGLRTALIEQVTEFAVAVLRESRVDDRPELQAGDVHDEVLGPVRQHHGHDVSPADPDRSQEARQPGGPVVRLSVAGSEAPGVHDHVLVGRRCQAGSPQVVHAGVAPQ